MKLLDTLIKKRDYHVGMAQKFTDLIAVVRGDEDFAKHTHDRKLSIMDEARMMAAITTNGNGHGATKPHGSQTPEARAKQSVRMREQWKQHRATMMKAVKKGLKQSIASRKKNKKARQAAEKAAAATAATTGL